MSKLISAWLIIMVCTNSYANNSLPIDNDILTTDTKTKISDHSSSACFNEDLYKNGVIIKETLAINGASEIITYTTTVKTNQSFAGRKLIETTRSSPTELYKSYLNFENGYEYHYGSEYIGQNDKTFEVYPTPRIANKISMQPSELINEYSDFPQVYVGREILKTPLGTYDTCNFITGDYNEDNVYPNTYWVFAEGPYRGLTAKSVWRELEEDNNGNLYIVQTNNSIETINVDIIQK